MHLQLSPIRTIFNEYLGIDGKYYCDWLTLWGKLATGEWDCVVGVLKDKSFLKRALGVDVMLNVLDKLFDLVLIFILSKKQKWL